MAPDWVMRYVDLPTQDEHCRLRVTYHGVSVAELQAECPLPEDVTRAKDVRAALRQWDELISLQGRAKAAPNTPARATERSGC